LLALASCAAAEGVLVFAGTYTRAASKGIYSFHFDTSSGAVSGLKLAAETRNPSFLALHPNRRYLYGVNEVGDFGGQKSGSVSAFSIDHAAGALKPIDTVASRGESPAHLSLDPSGKWVIAANYSGGSIAVFPIGDDGALGEASDFVRRTGSSVHERQKGPHPHQIAFSKDGLLVPDLGTDEIARFTRSDGTLSATVPLRVTPGSGPRHIAFGPRGRYLYVLGEIDSSISVRTWPGFEEIQKISLLPADFTGRNTAAKIAADPEHLFVSNRGLDEIAVFKIGVDGSLEPAGRFSTLGKTPRNFLRDPSGKYLLVANQDSNNIVVFRIDRWSGALTATGAQVTVPMPVCLVFAEKRQ
jgi:6-phosphogluconolactonase